MICACFIDERALSGTGDIKDVGTKEGKNYSVNFPLKDGIDDESFMMIFDAVMAKVRPPPYLCKRARAHIFFVHATSNLNQRLGRSWRSTNPMPSCCSAGQTPSLATAWAHST